MTTDHTSTTPAVDILVVDDTIESLKLLTEILTRAGYRVRPVNGPQLALESALAHPPGLILLDVRMTEMDGFEVCHRLKQDERTADIPVIFVSALQDTEDRVQGFEVGGVDFVSKPFQEAEVLARVKTHLQLRTMQLYLGALVDERTAELREANKALGESEEKYRAVVEQAAEGILVMQDGRRKYYNPAWLEMTSYSAEEYDPFPFFSFVHPDDLEIAEETYQNLMSEGELGVTSKLRIILKSGDIKWVSIRGSRIQWEGKPAGMVFVEDITDRKLAEEQYRTFFTENVSAVFWAEMKEPIPIDLPVEEQADGIFREAFIKDASHSTARMYGLTREELLGNMVVTLWNAEGYQDRNSALHQYLQRFVRSEYTYKLAETREQTKDGRDLWLLISLKGIVEDGRLVRIWGSQIDITERKRAETALQEARVFTDNLIDTANVIIVGLDATGGVQSFNPAAERITGYTKKELEGKNWFEVLVPTEIYPQTWQEFERLLEGGLPRYFENPILTKDGEERIITWSNNEISVGEKIVGTISFGVDITERKQAERELQLYQQKLKALAVELTLAEERERRRIAADLHDEVGQTLAFARIQLATAREDMAESQATAILDDVSDTIRQAIRDTRDLVFDLSSPLLNELGLPAALAEWLEEQVARKHGLQTEFKLAGEKIVLDEDVRAILFRNTRELLTNVVKHAQAGKVSVRLARVGDEALVIVEDDGNGFDPLAAAETTGREGGFGLFSIRERMLDLGGSLEIVSEPGQGCTAILTAPLGNNS